MTKPRLWVEVDVVIFTVHEGQLKVLLVQRPEDSSAFPGAWALPGGSVEKHMASTATIEEAAMAELKRKTGTEAPYLEQLYTVGGSTRDPRGWTVSITYFALMPHALATLTPHARWWSADSERMMSRLAFDHRDILAKAVERLRAKAEYTAILGYVLEDEFTLAELQSVFEVVMGEKLARSSFQRGLERAGLVRPTGHFTERESHRPAQLYQFTDIAKAGLFFPRSPHRSTAVPTAGGAARRKPRP